METTNHQESIEKKKSVGYRAPFFYDCFFFLVWNLSAAEAVFVCGAPSSRVTSEIIVLYWLGYRVLYHSGVR